MFFQNKNNSESVITLSVGTPRVSVDRNYIMHHITSVSNVKKTILRLFFPFLWESILQMLLFFCQLTFNFHLRFDIWFFHSFSSSLMRYVSLLCLQVLVMPLNFDIYYIVLSYLNAVFFSTPQKNRLSIRYTSSSKFY